MKNKLLMITAGLLITGLVGALIYFNLQILLLKIKIAATLILVGAPLIYLAWKMKK